MNAQGGEPYASVIVPTHERAWILDLAIESIRRQTVANIEIVICGDGVTDDVRTLAHRLANADSRIVFHDFAKGKRRGGDNRDRAVHMARSDRIFYCDDDDLLMPDHVAILGPLLDRYDAVDSATTFASLSGEMQVCIVNHARGPMREALAAGTFKRLMDTHFAHRKETYARLGAWDSNAVSPTISFFQKFAASPSVRWKTIASPTAVSFNGRLRQHLTAAQRREELERWSRQLFYRDCCARLVNEAWYDWHVFDLAQTLGGDWPKTLEGFASALFISTNSGPSGSTTDVSYTLPDTRFRALESLFALMRKEAIQEREVGPLAVRLAQPLIGWPRPNEHERVGILLRDALGPESMAKALSQFECGDTHASELRAFLECWLDMVERRPQQAFQRIKAVIDCASSYYGGEARIQAAVAMRQAGDLAASLAWARAAIEYDPSLKTGHQLAADILLADGKIAEARAVAEESRSHIPEHIADALVRRIEDASRDRSLA